MSGDQECQVASDQVATKTRLVNFEFPAFIDINAVANFSAGR